MAKNFEIIIRVGVSNVSLSEAIKNVVKETHLEKSVAWFEVTEQRGRVADDGSIEFQVTVKIGRKLG
ncbi:dodecin family protein [candidate division KSB1 bacterium]|nr:dodecin family protein [candidate division KSB1 bacterium]